MSCPWPKVKSFYTSSFPGCKPEGSSFLIEKEEGGQFLIASILLNLTRMLLALTTGPVGSSLTTHLIKMVAVSIVTSAFTYVLASVTQKSQKH